uniref:Solute carrier family 35 member F3 n=1 Tax=Schistocephalus solidus TaxID=70667 RepID=A0A0X3NZW1_SCHSO
MGGPLTSNGHSKHISFISGSEDLSTNIRSLEVDGISKKIRRFGKSVSKSTTQGRGLKPSTSLALTKPYESADTASLETNTDIQTNDCALSEYTGSALGRQSQEQHRKPTCFCSRLLRAVCQCVLGASMLVMFSMASVTFMAAIQHCYRMPVRSNLSMENFTLSRRNASHGVSNSPTFLTYMLTSGMGLMLPVVLYWPKYASSQEDGLEKSTWTDFLFVLSEDRHDWRSALGRTFFLTCLWLAYVYSLIRSLEELPLIDCVVIICTSPCYLYLFSWIILHKRFLASRIVAFVISSCGTILLIYLDQKLFGSKVLATFAVVSQAFFTVS